MSVYENFVRQIAGERLQDQHGELKEALERDEQRQKLQRENAALENKIRHEKQFNIQVAPRRRVEAAKEEMGG